MFKTYWNEKLQLVEAELAQIIPQKSALSSTLCEAMNYSLMAGGKRLRPVLLIAAADAVGGEGDSFVKSACAIEMIHTYSLIHDDLPAMDNDDYRRGKLTNHKVYGDGMAVLAGDALLTMAFEVLCSQKNVNAENRLRVVREMSFSAGPNGMVGGQAIDLLSENKRIDMKTLKQMHEAKTGALFCAAIRSGAILANATDREVDALTIYAEKFGLAFQITDDILDVIGSAEKIGKPVGSDERNHKSTYVTLTSLAEAKKMAAEAVEDALHSLDIFGSQADFLRSIVQYLESRDK
ncbi:geranylgeranyl diphosphate synthase, type II [Propionispira arboris]|uniref:Farnesyl diphosphate synthase n=1 Tax=Propionispira arboris TaxID=84035 RepID=A0A1H6VQ75_9FIRM|nr:farnesyl diphosphate synthase [Propionispira arboris]SEJ06781.1 geranylgeranyl diphosphate synthase, type II [Propionispira arboris]